MDSPWEPASSRSDVERLASDPNLDEVTARLLADAQTLIDALGTAAGELADAGSYVPEYFWEKWGFDDSLAKVQAAHAAFSAAIGQRRAV
jgi:hypothetical protein